MSNHVVGHGGSELVGGGLEEGLSLGFLWEVVYKAASSYGWVVLRDHEVLVEAASYGEI